MSAAALADELARIAGLLDAHASAPGAPGDTEAASLASDPVAPRRCPTVAGIAQALRLSEFETDVLLLTAGIHLDGELAARCAAISGGDPRPTFALALASLPDPHWDASSPDRPLRRWRLIELADAATLPARPLEIDEAILHRLTGVAATDQRLNGLVRLTPPGLPLSPSQADVAGEVAATVAAIDEPTLVRLDGDDAATLQAAAARAADVLGGSALLVDVDALPPPGPHLDDTARRLMRATLLDGAVIVLTGDHPALLGLLDSHAIIVLDGGATTVGRVLVRRTIATPDRDEQATLWRTALGLEPADTLTSSSARSGTRPRGDRPADLLSDAIDEISENYRFPPAVLAGIARELRVAADPVDALVLRRACRTRARMDLDGLAERVDTRAAWDDLVLPEAQAGLLRDIVAHVRHRTRVHRGWGFAAATDRGLGVTALFSGESGTGKTLAAEVLAHELALDLYRIDLSAVVSKYIGETEKNLSRLFDAAEASGAVLLFDEADALFGKRGEVRDGHDRYANLEVSYLLQRMETYRGLAILTTNLRSNIDRGFTRRLRFVVQFPFPDADLRRRIWARAFPKATPTADLDPAALAALQVPGGAIRAIALGAAFAAAADDAPVGLQHVLHAARVEYAKADRTLTHSEAATVRGGA